MSMSPKPKDLNGRYWSKMLKNIVFNIRKLNHKRIDFLRYVRTHFLVYLLNQKNCLFGLPSENKKPKAIILRLDGKLGDTITITGLYKELVDAGYDLTVVTRDHQSFIYDYISTPMNVFKIKNIFSTLLLLLKLSTYKYDVLICTTHLLDPSSLLLARFLKSYKKSVLLNREIKFFDYHVCDQFEEIHITERYNRLLQSVDICPKGYVFHYYLNPPAILENKYSSDFVILKSNKVIILNSFAGSSDRNFKKEVTQKIIEKVLERNPGHIVISIGSSFDHNTLKIWESDFYHKFGTRWKILSSGDFALNYSAIKMAELVISPDTAIIHLASALNKKIVGIYRVANNRDEFPFVWAPLSGQNQFKIVYAYNGQIDLINPDLISQLTVDLIAN